MIMPARTHGESKTKLYMAWQNMKARCYRKSSREYDNYGGRGIAVCNEWRSSYESFRDWAFSNGYNPNAGHLECTLDRIDVNKGYLPDNCRWISNREQQNNKQNNVHYTFNGKTQNLTQWAKELGICQKTLQKRIHNWGVERAFTEPLITDRRLNLIGNKYGRLTVVERVNNKGASRFKCVCDCGNTIVTNGQSLKDGHTKSCGCLNREKASEHCRNIAKKQAEKKNNRIVQCYSMDGHLIAEYTGTKSASEITGISRSSIQRALRHPECLCRKMKWRWG